jgi:DNA-binding NarL/FixJ family response regulator
MTLRVLLVDDHKMVREALRRLLLDQESDIEVVGETGDGQSAIELAEKLRPNIVVMDIGLPILGGVEATRKLRAAHPEIKVIALSTYSDRRFVSEMLNAGASAYVAKTSAGDELLNAIRAVAANQPYVCPEIASALVASVRRDDTLSRRSDKSSLTRREREVLSLMAEGNRTQNIAERLYIAPSTVEVHRRNIMRKLDLHNIAELTQYAIRENLIKI